MRPRIILTLSLVALLALAMAPSLMAQMASDVSYGEPVALGDGVVRTYVIHDANGAPIEVGVAISETAMATLPDLSQKPPMESFLAMDLAMPEGTPAPYKHVGFDWNSTGHPPMDIYTIPHFDFHFYTIDTETKGAIVPGETDVPAENGEFAEGPFAEGAMMAPEAGFLPASYAYAPGSAVPLMGGHWIDPASHEFHGQTFDKTFIYGTWNGGVIFLEPMITKALIESKPAESWEIAAPEKVAVAGWYPSAYTVKYDAEAKEYRIALVGLAERS